MNPKIIITKSGYTAPTETDLNNIIFHSDYNTLKYYTSGSASISVSKSAADPPYEIVGYIDHNLGFYPYYEVYVQHQSVWQMIGTAYTTAGFPYGVFRKFEAFATTTRLYFKVRGDTGTDADSYTANFRYKIFRNNLGL